MFEAIERSIEWCIEHADFAVEWEHDQVTAQARTELMAVRELFEAAQLWSQLDDDEGSNLVPAYENLKERIRAIDKLSSKR